MTKPPPHKAVQSEYVQSAVRMPRKLRAELQDAAERNGRSMNAEILARLEASPLEQLIKQNAELKLMLREILDAVRE